MTAATLKAIAATAAIENRAIHMVAFLLAGSIEFHIGLDGKPLTTPSAIEGSDGFRPQKALVEEYGIETERCVSSPHGK